MKKTDLALGMHRAIKRRDFIHDVGLAALGVAAGPAAALAGGAVETDASYPPALTGLRGSHPGAYEVAHALAREGRKFSAARALDERYDAVVVGAGISGLAAAHYYRQRFGRDSRILILENHDDFGGHARRNEFHQGGRMKLSLGGTHNLEHWEFSKTVRNLMKTLGIDVHKMRRNMEFRYGRNGKRGTAVWFDEATYGEDRLVTNYTLERWRPGASLDCITEFPMSERARRQLKELFTTRKNVFEGRPRGDVDTHLSEISYPDFLRRYAGLEEESLQLFETCMHPSWGIELRALSAREALEDGLPGRNLVGPEAHPSDFDYPVAMFPDGNASVARLLVHNLIPKVAQGTNADNVAVAKFDYSQLDDLRGLVRLRLNSTVVHVSNSGSGVDVTYVKEGQPVRVSSRHCVLACYHSILPHLCPELSAEQKAAQQYQVKIPLLLTNVLIRSSAPMDRLGIAGATCPGRMHRSVFLFKGISTGGYQHAMADDGPVALTFWGTLSPPASAKSLKDQLRASRARMLELKFEDYEREVRTVLDGMLGPAGFDVQRDILAITVNRWPHGYSYEYMDLWDEDWPKGSAPHEIARRPLGNISIANSDAGASAYTHVAIDQAYRAVSELPRA